MHTQQQKAVWCWGWVELIQAFISNTYLWQAVHNIYQWIYSNNVLSFHLNNYLVISDPSSGSSTDLGGQRVAINRLSSPPEAALTLYRYLFGYSKQSNAAHSSTQSKTIFLHSLTFVKLLIKSWLSAVVWTSLMPQQTDDPSALVYWDHTTTLKASCRFYRE